MKIVKLINNKAFDIIIIKHSRSEINAGIVTLAKIPQKKHREFLWEKLLEEVGEAITEKSLKELDDVIEVCRALKGKKTKFSDRWALVTSKGHYKNEKE